MHLPEIKVVRFHRPQSFVQIRRSVVLGAISALNCEEDLLTKFRNHGAVDFLRATFIVAARHVEIIDSEIAACVVLLICPTALDLRRGTGRSELCVT